MKYCSRCMAYVNTKDTFSVRKIDDKIEERTATRNCEACGKFIESVVTNERIFGEKEK